MYIHVAYFLHTQIMGKCYSLHFVYFMQQTCLWCETDKGAVLIFVYVLFHASSRTNARDRIRLLEDGLAREHCHHCHGNQPGGGGPGEYGLLVLTTYMHHVQNEVGNEVMSTNKQTSDSRIYSSALQRTTVCKHCQVPAKYLVHSLCIVLHL